jgi:hypothetical protein
MADKLSRCGAPRNDLRGCSCSTNNGYRVHRNDGEKANGEPLFAILAGLNKDSWRSCSSCYCYVYVPFVEFVLVNMGCSVGNRTYEASSFAQYI